jgi:RND superfamily putative drug exporter
LETVDTSTLLSYIAEATVYSAIVVEATQEGFTVSSPTATTKPPGRLARLADFAFRRRRRIVLGWIAALVVAFGAASQLGGTHTADYSTPGSDSKAAQDRLASRFPAQTPYTIDIVWQAKHAAAGNVAKRVDGLLAKAERLPGVGDGVTARNAQFSRDGTIGVVRLPLSVKKVDDVPVATGEKIISMVGNASRDGLRVEAGGQPIGQAQQGAISSEMVGLAIAALVLLVTFGTVVAAGLPLATALFGLGISSALGALLTAVIDTPDWSTSVAAMIGIGVGIDYALLIITRFRGALAGGAHARAATSEAISTAGRSALIAGGTVVISLMGLFLTGLPYMYGVALAAIASVVVVMAASVTLLPALLGFAGERVNKLRIPGAGRVHTDPSATLSGRWSRVVQRRPLAAAVAGIAILLALAAPVLGLRLGFPDAGNDRAETTTRQAYGLMATGFGAGSAGPLQLVADVHGSADRAAVATLAGDLGREPGVASVAKPVFNPAGDTAVLSAVPTTSPQDAATADLIHTLRDDVLPRTGLHVDVGGATASFVDQGQKTAGQLPIFIGGVVGLSFLLLLAAFRAPVVALKAGVMNLLSIGAAYGVVALVADGGFVGGLVGIDTATPVPPFLPVIMFAILFGLSMDYEVFLLSRVREAYLAGGNTSSAVTEGLARTARVITAAAAIMVAVFGAFVLSPDVPIKLIGVGLASAILIDATIVRLVLVPAVMQLLGDRNWWLPRWLDRLVPRLEIEPAPAG